MKIFFGLSIVMELKVQKQHYFDFQSNLSSSKIDVILLIFFTLKNIKKWDQLLLLTYFDNFDF